MFYFNWFDLLQKSKKDNDSIIILTYASTFGYNKKIANSSFELLRLLNIHRMSKILNEYIIIKAKSFEIFNKYKIEEPQSYFNNKSFLTSLTSSNNKIQYLWLLSHRKVEDKKPFIIKDYFSGKEIDGIKNNPFISIEKDKINFILENTYTPRT